METMTAFALIRAEGLRSHNASCCGCMRAHFAACRVGAWKAHDVCDDLTDEKISCMLHSQLSSALGELNWSDTGVTKGM